jgi:hypothetical protein
MGGAEVHYVRAAVIIKCYTSVNSRGGLVGNLEITNLVATVTLESGE